MRTRSILAACAAAALAALAACGDGRGSDGLTSEERQKLNEHAENLEDPSLTDTSPDSLTVNDEWMQAETGEAGGGPSNAAATETPANGQ